MAFTYNKVMDSGPMQLAMIISAITFAQTSILNYTYFLTNVFRSIVRLNHVLSLLKYPFQVDWCTVKQNQEKNHNQECYRVKRRKKI